MSAPGWTATRWSTAPARRCCPGSSTATCTCCSAAWHPLKTLQTPFSYPYFEAVRNLRTTLDLGITTVRDAGGSDLGVKEAVATGLIPGPRMLIAVSMLSQTGGHGDGWYPSGCTVSLVQPHPGRPNTVVDGPEEIRRTVRELIRAGADVIKVATSGGVLSARDDPRHGHFRDDEVAMMVHEAEAAGISVMAHAQATEGIKTAVRNGVRSIEHGIYLDDEAIEMMLDWGTWLVPTLAAPRAVLEQAAAGVPYPDAVLAKARMVLEEHSESVRRAIAAGVTVAMGTDSGVGPHGRNLSELQLLVDCGMTPEQALHAATQSACELLDVAEDRGTSRPGSAPTSSWSTATPGSWPPSPPASAPSTWTAPRSLPSPTPETTRRRCCRGGRPPARCRHRASRGGEPRPRERDGLRCNAK